jgi:hypothetical protein
VYAAKTRRPRRRHDKRLDVFGVQRSAEGHGKYKRNIFHPQMTLTPIPLKV